MRYFRALVQSASLFLPATSASANVLTPADYQSFQDLDVKMLSIGDDLYALITTRPEAHAPDCLMQLAFKFDAVQADHLIREQSILSEILTPSALAVLGFITVSYLVGCCTGRSAGWRC